MIMEKLNTLTLMLLDRVMLRCRSECWLHQASLVNNNQQVEEEDQDLDQVQEDLDQVLEEPEQELTTTGEIQEAEGRSVISIKEARVRGGRTVSEDQEDQWRLPGDQ